MVKLNVITPDVYGSRGFGATFHVLYLVLLVWAPCLMHRCNKNPTLSQSHNLPTHLPIEFLTYLCASFLTSQALVPTFSFPAFSLPILLTFSLFLSKTTLGKWTVCSLPWLRTDTVAIHYSPRGSHAVRSESGEGTPVFAGPGPVVCLWRTRAPSQTDERT